MKNIKELVIDRARWGVAPKVEGALYNSETKQMCCLGFLARACGAKVNDIKDVPFCAEGEAPSVFVGESEAALNASDANDKKIGENLRINGAVLTSQRHREQVVRAIFKENGIKVKFVGRFPKAKKEAA